MPNTLVTNASPWPLTMPATFAGHTVQPGSTIVLPLEEGATQLMLGELYSLGYLTTSETTAAAVSAERPEVRPGYIMVEPSVDGSSALQAALDRAAELGGGVVMLRPGTHVLQDAVTATPARTDNRVVLAGCGSASRIVSLVGAGKTALTIGAYQRFELRDLAWLGVRRTGGDDYDGDFAILSTADTTDLVGVHLDGVRAVGAVARIRSGTVERSTFLGCGAAGDAEFDGGAIVDYYPFGRVGRVVACEFRDYGNYGGPIDDDPVWQGSAQGVPSWIRFLNATVLSGDGDAPSSSYALVDGCGFDEENKAVEARQSPWSGARLGRLVVRGCNQLIPPFTLGGFVFADGIDQLLVEDCRTVVRSAASSAGQFVVLANDCGTVTVRRHTTVRTAPGESAIIVGSTNTRVIVDDSDLDALMANPTVEGGALPAAHWTQGSDRGRYYPCADAGAALQGMALTRTTGLTVEMAPAGTLNEDLVGVAQSDVLAEAAAQVNADPCQPIYVLLASSVSCSVGDDLTMSTSTEDGRFSTSPTGTGWCRALAAAAAGELVLVERALQWTDAASGVTDEFDRGNSSGLGTADTGETWIAAFSPSRMDISSQQARAAVLDGSGNAGAVIDAGFSDMLVQVTVGVWAHQIALIARYVDDSNHLLLDFISDGVNFSWTLYKRISSAYVSLASGSSPYPAPTGGDTIALYCKDTAVQARVNGVTIASVTVAELTSATKAGLFAFAVGELFSGGFSVTPT